MAILLIMAGGLASCESTDIEQHGNVYIKIGDIHGKVVNAAKYSNVVAVKLIINNHIELARGERKDCGGFTIILPKTLEPNNLHVYRFNRGLLSPIVDRPPNMSISNKNAKAGTVQLFGVDKNDNIITSFHPLKVDEDGNVKRVYISYVDSDVTIHGYYERRAVQDFLVGEIRYIAYVRTSTTYSVELKKGWNVWWLSSIRCIKEFTFTNRWSTSPPISRVKWYSLDDKHKKINN